MLYEPVPSMYEPWKNGYEPIYSQPYFCIIFLKTGMSDTEAKSNIHDLTLYEMLRNDDLQHVTLYV